MERKLHSYYRGDIIREHEMGGTSSTYTYGKIMHINRLLKQYTAIINLSFLLTSTEGFQDKSAASVNWSKNLSCYAIRSFL